jgi:hypothetical protein
MADYGTYDTTNSPTGPEKPRTFGLKILSDIAILRRNGWGDTLTAVAGSTRLYDAGGGAMGMKIIQSDGSTEVEALGGEYKLRAELDCDGINGIELKYPRVKGYTTGNMLAVAAGNEGVLQLDTVRKLLAMGADSGGRRVYFAGFDQDGGHFKRIPLRLADVNANAHSGLNTDDSSLTQAVTATPALLDTWENEETAYGVTPNAAAGTLTIKQKGTYLVNFQASIESGTNNIVYQFHLRKDAVEEPEGMHRKIAVSGDVGSGSFCGLVDCDVDEVLSVYVEGSPSATLTVIDAQFTAVRVGSLSTDNAAEPRMYDNVGGFQLDDANDTIPFVTAEPIPFMFTGGHDGQLEILVRLDQAETGTDVIDLKTDYETAVIGTGAFGGTTTAATDTGLVTIGAGTALGTLHRVLIPLTYNDGTNPLAADALLRGILKRDGLTNVGSITVIGGALLIPVFGGIDYQI